MAEFTSLCTACRIGDVDSVDKILLSGANVNVNDVDEFDNTPLYLASLCGHEEVVKLLLTRGALCDRDRYEGIRCIYGALTDKIKYLLLSYSVTTKVSPMLPFAIYVRSMQNIIGSLITKDVAMRQGEFETCTAHKFMLSCRSEYFAERLKGKWDGLTEITLQEDVDMHIFIIAIGYLYLQHDSWTLMNDMKYKERKLLLAYAKKLKIPELVQALELLINEIDIKEQNRIHNDLQLKLAMKGRVDIIRLVEEEIIGNKITAEQPITDEQIRGLQLSTAYPDVIFCVDDEEEGLKTYYPVHRAILCRDHSYFGTMFTSPMFEDQESEDFVRSTSTKTYHDRLAKPLAVTNLPVRSPEVAEIVIKFLYYDEADIPLEHSVDTLFAADILLNDRLKTMCAVTITASSTPPPGYDWYDILRASWDTRVHRLEDHVAKQIAYNIDEYLLHSEFNKIVMESAERIKGRQDTDTIELIDDIRYHLAKKWRIDFEGLFEGQKNDIVRSLPGYDSYELDLSKIESLLVELGLDA